MQFPQTALMDADLLTSLPPRLHRDKFLGLGRQLLPQRLPTLNATRPSPLDAKALPHVVEECTEMEFGTLNATLFI